MGYITLLLYCEHCGHPVTVEYQATEGAFDLRENLFECPECADVNRLALNGTIVTVWLGHEVRASGSINQGFDSSS